MAIEFRTNLFKVVKNGEYDPYGYRSSAQPVSALLNVSGAKVTYPVNSNQWVGPAVAGTPLICFDNVNDAFDFAAKFPGRTVYEAEAYGEVVALDQVLSVKRAGWDAALQNFWKDVLAKADLKGYKTITAHKGSVAVFGVMRLTQKATRPNVVAAEAPAAAAE